MSTGSPVPAAQTPLFSIRPVRITDAAEVNVLSQELGYDYPTEKVAARIEYILSETKDALFAAELDGSVIGYIHGAPYELLFYDPQVNILALVVNNKYRRLGVGGLLLEALERWTREHGYAGIRLVSGSDRVDAHRFYLKHGYLFRKDQKNFAKRL